MCACTLFCHCLFPGIHARSLDAFCFVIRSYGTIGFLVSAKLKIIPAKPWVLLKYQPLYNKEDCVSEFEKASRNLDNEYVEELMYNREEVSTREIDR